MLGVENGEQVTHLKSFITGKDQYRKNVYDYTPQELFNVVIGQGSTAEENAGELQQVDDFLTLYFTAGDPEIKATDHFIVRGKRYEAIGYSFLWKDPFSGEVFGASVKVKRREG